MPERDVIILMVMGGAFILLGFIAIIWGKREDKGYYNATASHPDVREYLEHWPPRPGLGALKIGGWVAIAVGLVALMVGGAFLFFA